MLVCRVNSHLNSILLLSIFACSILNILAKNDDDYLCTNTIDDNSSESSKIAKNDCMLIFDSCPGNETYSYGRCVLVTEKMKFEDFKCRLGSRRILPEKIAGKLYWQSNDFHTFQSYTNFTNKKCIAEDVGPHVVDCDEFHRHACGSTNLQIYNCPEDCVSSSVPTESCFCLEKYKNERPRNEFCTNLANITIYDDYTIIQKWYSSKNPCWIGSNLYGHVQPEFGRYLALNKKGVLYQQDASLECAICQMKPQVFQKAVMSLKFAPKDKKLYLTVNFPKSLYVIDEDFVFCFTDASEEIEKTVKVKESYRSKKGEAVVLKLDLEKYPGRYWCLGYQLPTLDLVMSNTIVAYKKMKGNEYSLRLLNISTGCNISNYGLDDAMKTVIKTIDIPSVLRTDNVFLKVVKIYEIMKHSGNSCECDILLHITSTKKAVIMEEFLRFSNFLKNSSLDVKFFRSSYYCLPEVTGVDTKLTWRLTGIGYQSTPLEFCITRDRLPVTRTCVGDFSEGGVWSDIDETCSDDHDIPTTSKQLHKLYKHVRDTDGNVIMEGVKKITTEQSGNFTPMDFFFISNILKDEVIEFDAVKADDLAKSIDNVMLSRKESLKLAQNLYRSTDDLLRILEYYLSQQDNGTYVLLQENQLLIQKSFPYIDGISGVALYNGLGGFRVEKLMKNISSISVLDKVGLLIATYVNEDILANLTQELTVEEKQNISVNIVVFLNSALFIDGKDDENVTSSSVVSVSIPGFGSYLPDVVPVLIKSEFKNNDGNSCVYWDYEENLEFMGNRTGFWSKSGAYDVNYGDDGLYLCEFSHLTHFALLVLNGHGGYEEERNYTEIYVQNQVHNNFLTLITIIGCILSIIGACGIFATAVVFEKWRERLGPKLLVHLSLALFLEIIVTQIAGMDEWQVRQIGCTAIGIILQYSVLSKFFWMLITAYLQYLRFIKIFQAIPDRFLLKSIIIGWGVPLIPTLLTAVLAPQSYGEGTHKFCYPKDLSLYLGVFLPVILIAATNTFVFCKILYNINLHSQTSKPSDDLRKCKNKDNLKRQVYLAILLFFLLGLPWVFGILAEVIEVPWVEIILSYIFCASATLQGFVLFIFYIILDPDTNTMWKKWVWKVIFKIK